MDIKAYILSGIIESYVLGIATESEASELLYYAEKYPEIRKAIDECETDFGKGILANPIQPPVGLKEKIWSKITNEDTSTAEDKKETFLHVPPQKTVSATWSKWLLAATILGILICVYLIRNYQKTE